MQETATFREFAKKVAYSEAMVRKWVKNGTISKKSLDYDDPKRPTIIVELGLKDLAKNQRKSINSEPAKRNAFKDKVGTPGKKKSYVPQINEETGEAIFTEEELEAGLSTVQMLSMSLTQLDKMKKIHEIKVMRMKHDKEAKLLVPRELVNKELYESAQMLRSAFENFSGRTVDQIRDAPDRDSALIIMEDEVDMILNSTADIQEKLDNAIEQYE